MSTLATVQRIIAGESGVSVEDLQPTRPLEELEIDSLAVIEAMFLLEREFKVQMPDGQVPTRTVQDIADPVDQLMLDRDATKAGVGPR